MTLDTQRAKNTRTLAILQSGQHDTAVALTKGFERAFLVGAGFALAGAVLTVVLISSRDSRAHSTGARQGAPESAVSPLS